MGIERVPLPLLFCKHIFVSIYENKRRIKKRLLRNNRYTPYMGYYL